MCSASRTSRTARTGRPPAPSPRRAPTATYCNPAWIGNGKLSATDIAGVVQFYGEVPWSREFGYDAGGWRVEPGRVSDDS
jgi:hypothetical protein